MAELHLGTEFIHTRAAKMAAAYNNRDVGTALTMFVGDGLEYSDYGASPFEPIALPPRRHSRLVFRSKSSNHLTVFLSVVIALNMDKPALANSLVPRSPHRKYFEPETVSMSAHRGFTVWEWKMYFTENKGAWNFEDINAKESKDSEVLTMVGVSVT